MNKVIREDEIGTAEIWRYDDILAVKHAEDVSGVELFRARRIATLYHPDTPATPVDRPQLLILVDDPDDFEEVERLKQVVSKAWRRE